MSKLQDKLSIKKTELTIIEKEKPVMETKLIKKTNTVTIDLFDNPTLPDMITYLVKVSKKTMIEDGVNSIKSKLNTFWFDRLFQENHLNYLSSQYDKLGKKVIEASTETIDVDIEKLQGVLTQKQIEHILSEQENATSYSFEELKETLVVEFKTITDKVSDTLSNFRLI
jgi:hypothetical protein